MLLQGDRINQKNSQTLKQRICQQLERLQVRTLTSNLAERDPGDCKGAADCKLPRGLAGS